MLNATRDPLLFDWDVSWRINLENSTDKRGCYYRQVASWGTAIQI
jgi:hypothetical protein